VAAGTKVTVTDQDTTTHTWTSDNGKWDSGNLNSSNPSFSFTFSDPGTYTYHCKIHSFMTGKITVT
jgi:plastocyanin